MLFFAHIGITLAVFYILALLIPRIRPRINYLYVGIGSVLPDIIDKIIGRWMFEDVFGNGRIFAHTLLFVVVLTVIGFHQLKRKDSRVLTLAGGSFVHLILDSMWKAPTTLLWPLLGWKFAKGVEYGSFFKYLMVVYRNLGNMDSPAFISTLLTEGTGLIIVLIFIIGHLIKRRRERRNMV